MGRGLAEESKGLSRKHAVAEEIALGPTHVPVGLDTTAPIAPIGIAADSTNPPPPDVVDEGSASRQSLARVEGRISEIYAKTTRRRFRLDY